MSKGLCSSLEYLKNGTNKAVDTKSSIIFISKADKKIKDKIKEMEEKARQGNKKEESQKIEFDFSEIETIVLRDER